MFAIYMRELKSYFLTAIGYVYCGMFLVVSGLAFAQCTLLKQSTDSIGEYFVWMIIIFAVLIPLLTMKLIAEDRKTRTDQILLTSPVSVTGIVMGKYLAALTVYAATFLVNSFNFVLLAKYGEPNAISILTNILGVFLLGAAFIAIGNGRQCRDAACEPACGQDIRHCAQNRRKMVFGAGSLRSVHTSDAGCFRYRLLSEPCGGIPLPHDARYRKTPLVVKKGALPR